MADPSCPSKQIGWGDSSGVGEFDFFMGKLNVVQRIALLEGTVVSGPCHYVDGISYVRCLGEACPLCLTKRPKPRYVTWIVLYASDNFGNLVTPLQAKVVLWVLGEDKKRSIQMLSATLPQGGDIRNFDLVVQCSDQNYQKLTIQPSGTGATWMTDPGIKNAIATVYKDYHSRIKVERYLGKELSYEGMVNVNQYGNPFGPKAAVDAPAAPGAPGFPPAPGFTPAPGFPGAKGFTPAPTPSNPQNSNPPAPGFPLNPTPPATTPPATTPPAHTPNTPLPQVSFDELLK